MKTFGEQFELLLVRQICSSINSYTIQNKGISDRLKINKLSLKLEHGEEEETMWQIFIALYNNLPISKPLFYFYLVIFKLRNAKTLETT